MKLFSLYFSVPVEAISIDNRHAPDENAANMSSDEAGGFRHDLGAEPAQYGHEKNEHQPARCLPQPNMTSAGNQRSEKQQNGFLTLWHDRECRFEEKSKYP